MPISIPDFDPDDTPPSDKIRALIARERNARENMEESYHRVDVAAARAEKASARAEFFDWKVNALLALGFSALAGMAWVVARVDAIEERVQAVSLAVARVEARAQPQD